MHKYFLCIKTAKEKIFSGSYYCTILFKIKITQLYKALVLLKLHQVFRLRECLNQ